MFGIRHTSSDRFTYQFRLSHLLPPIALVFFGWLLLDRVREFDPAQIHAVVQTVSIGQWSVAVVATGLSFLALGQYDAVIHRALRTGIAPRRARHSGMRAIAISQLLGFGSLTSAVVRWRCLPELSALKAVHLSVLVSLSFLAAWSIVTALMLGLGGVSLPARDSLLAGATGAAALGIALPWLHKYFPRLRDILGGLDAADLGRLVLWALIDTGCAAMALGVFLWGHADPMTIFCAYLVGLGAALISNAPGGLGAFELTLMALLPSVPVPELLAAILAYRLVYFGLPALFSIPGLVRGPTRPNAPLHLASDWQRTRILASPPCPEWGFVRQNGALLVTPDGTSGWHVNQAGQYLTALGPPLGSAQFSAFANYAKSRDLIPCLYKADALTAAMARRAGWQVLRIAQNAEIGLPTWSLSGSKHRQLRRKLRKADAAGIRISTAQSDLPWPAMDAIAAAWEARHGTQKGFSMGRYVSGNPQGQLFLTAWSGTRLLGFASFQTAPDQWVLDLMRSGEDAPDGMMYALIVAAIEMATNAGANRLSLAATLSLPKAYQPIQNHLPNGLERFKRSFDPQWRPRYLVTPKPWQIPGALAAITRAVHAPDPVNDHGAHDHHANFAFDLGVRPCDSTRQTILLPVATGGPDNVIGPIHDQRSFPPSRDS